MERISHILVDLLSRFYRSLLTVVITVITLKCQRDGKSFRLSSHQSNDIRYIQRFTCWSLSVLRVLLVQQSISLTGIILLDVIFNNINSATLSKIYCLLLSSYLEVSEKDPKNHINNMTSNTYSIRKLLLILYVSGLLISESSAFNNAGRSFASPRIHSGLAPSHLSSFRNTPLTLCTHKDAAQFSEKVS